MFLLTVLNMTLAFSENPYYQVDSDSSDHSIEETNQPQFIRNNQIDHSGGAVSNGMSENTEVPENTEAPENSDMDISEEDNISSDNNSPDNNSPDNISPDISESLLIGGIYIMGENSTVVRVGCLVEDTMGESTQMRIRFGGESDLEEEIYEEEIYEEEIYEEREIYEYKDENEFNGIDEREYHSNIRVEMEEFSIILHNKAMNSVTVMGQKNIQYVRNNTPTRGNL